MSLKSFVATITKQNQSPISTPSQLPRSVETIRKKYSDVKYVFKKCIDLGDEDNDRRWLVVLEKLSDTRTNEKRRGIHDSKFAKFRADKLKVIEIFDVNNLNVDRKSITNVYTDNKYEGYDDVIFHKIVYTVGDIVYPDFYDEAIENVCSNGIHYFKSFDTAFSYIKTSHMGMSLNTNKSIVSKH
jgi:hypothetical protein